MMTRPNKWFSISLLVFSFLSPNIGFSETELLQVVKTFEDSEQILDMEIGPHDVIWLGTENGLLSFDGKNWKRYSTDNGLNSNYIRHVAVAPNGDVWIATFTPDLDHYGKGITWFDGEKWTTFTTDDGLTGNYCDEFGIDKNGHVWAHTYNVTYTDGDPDTSNPGICFYDGTSWEVKKKSAYAVRSFAFDEDGVVWTTSPYRILHYDGLSFTEKRPESFDLIPFNLVFDSKGVLWMGSKYDTSGYTVISYNDGVWQKRSGPGERILSLAFDSKDVLWAGTEYYIGLLDGDQWVKQNIPNEYSNRRYCQLAFDSNDGLWVATRDALLRIPNNNSDVDTVDSVPVTVDITGNYPNPFNASTTIEFTLSNYAYTNLSIYNSQGQKISEPISYNLHPGTHTCLWNGKDMNGQPVASGIYFSCLKQNGVTKIDKMVFMK